MALTIFNEAVERLARELASQTGEARRVGAPRVLTRCPMTYTDAARP